MTRRRTIPRPSRASTTQRHAAHFLKRVTSVIRDRRAAKRADEDAVMRPLIAALPGSTRSELGELWEELHLGTSSEARFVKQVDRLETFLQSRLYLDNDPTLPMASFRQEVFETIDDPSARRHPRRGTRNELTRKHPVLVEGDRPQISGDLDPSRREQLRQEVLRHPERLDDASCP